uniref:myelin regulatory factor-like protein n=1 Tax=Pristiophorus japonicus TaxID=55135 RepID=UPI00398EAAFC
MTYHMDVLGENEALQQFFEDQDVTGAPENPFIDTSMLEAYISNDLELGAITLPDSPPDSVSECCSPPQMTDVQYGGTWTAKIHPQKEQPSSMSHHKAPCRFTELMLPTHSNLPQQHRHNGLWENLVKPDVTMRPSNSSVPPNYVGVPNLPVQQSTIHHPEILIQHSKKRKRSDLCENTIDYVWNDIQSQEDCNSREHSSDICGYDTDSQNGVSMDWSCLKWHSFQPNHWATLCNSSYNELPAPGYQVAADKGFNFSTADDSFVCQKKNHFQVTVHVGLIGCPKYVKTPLGLKPIETFVLKVFGVKVDATNQMITIEQSQSDRSKKPFNPIRIDLPGDQTTKITLGRLHFGETTTNNMRKKGKPNPDQRYFMLVVGLYAVCQNQNYLIAAHTSEKIIVRASNPSQFENEREVTWQKGQAPNALVCHGQVGINTDTPDEALVVCGNVKVMGTVMYPSDRRAKQNIHEVDTTEQLKRITQMRLVEYDYKPDFASKMGVDRPHETGIIAQEVKEILPSAVREVGDVTYNNGDKIENFLMVDKEQIFMENVGAVKELCKLTNNFEKRIQELEVWNKNLAKLKRIGSAKSTLSEKNRNSLFGRTSYVPPPKKPVLAKHKAYLNQKKYDCSPHKVFYIVIMALLGLMAFCVILISALYVLTLNEERSLIKDLNDSYISESFTTKGYTTFTPHTTLSAENTRSVYTTANIEIPSPEVSFCNILPCVTVHCCVPQSQRKGISNHRKKKRITKGHPVMQNLSKPELTTRQVTKMKGDWFDTSVRSIQVMESQQLIDYHHCAKGVHCGNGNYSYIIPINKYTPVNMRITLEMNTTAPLVVYKCTMNLGRTCVNSASSVSKRDVSQDMSQGYQHFWILPVAQLHECKYHFRVAAPGLADCRTNQNFAGIFFTDYYFYFYRQCS